MISTVERWRKGFRELMGFLGEVALSLGQALLHPSRIRWRETIYYLDLCGSKSFVIVCSICVLMGLILGFQAVVQMRNFGAEIFAADLVGFAIVKELGPLLVAMVATGRAGSAFAAEIGTMVVNEEVNALRTMGISLGRFLVVPKLLALLVALPVLTVFGDVAGIIGGMMVGLTAMPAVTYYERTVQILSPAIMLSGLFKSFVFAAIIALVGCYRGLQSGSDAQSVGRSATSAVVTSIFAVVIADAVITQLYMLFEI